MCWCLVCWKPAAVATCWSLDRAQCHAFRWICFDFDPEDGYVQEEIPGFYVSPS